MIFENKIKHFLERILYRNLCKTYNPNHINFQSYDSFIVTPTKIDGGKYIEVGKGTNIGKYAWLGAFDQYKSYSYKPSIHIGDHVSIGNFACITAINKIKIGNNCLISEYVYISDHYHGIEVEDKIPFIEQPLLSKGEVVIGDNCFIGFRASILSGVTLGDFCIVGAHSLVNKSFPSYTMIAGNPAKIIKRYSKEKKAWLNEL